MCAQLLMSADIDAGHWTELLNQLFHHKIMPPNIYKFKSYSNHTINIIIHLVEKILHVPLPLKYLQIF